MYMETSHHNSQTYIILMNSSENYSLEMGLSNKIKKEEKRSRNLEGGNEDHVGFLAFFSVPTLPDCPKHAVGVTGLKEVFVFIL